MVLLLRDLNRSLSVFGLECWRWINDVRFENVLWRDDADNDDDDNDDDDNKRIIGWDDMEANHRPS